MDAWKRHSAVLKRVSEHIVMGEVLVPGITDAQGDRVDRETVEKAAHAFLHQSRNLGTNHRQFKEVGEVVESFIARDGDPDFAPGAWVMAVKCSPQVWEKVQSGELTGFSIGGMARRLPDL
jgi:hypothetical protein